MTEYPIVVFGSDDDQVYIADVPDIRSCTAHGETPEEALHDARLDLADIREDARERGIALPPPTVQPMWRVAS